MLIGCVILLVVVLQTKGLQYAAGVAGIRAVVLALPALAIPLVRQLHQELVLTAEQRSPSADEFADAARAARPISPSTPV
jgi:hypothetical protein